MRKYSNKKYIVINLLINESSHFAQPRFLNQNFYYIVYDTKETIPPNLNPSISSNFNPENKYKTRVILKTQ